MLWIISGPTSVGKSTFITSPRCAEITGLPCETPVVFPANQSRLDEFGATDVLFHYNTLRPLDLKRCYEQSGLPTGQPAIRKATDFARDRPWNDLIKREVAKKAVVLVTSKQTILQRTSQRHVVESPTLIDLKNHPYPNQKWIDLIGQIDLAALCRAWCDELRSCGIPYTLVDSSDNAYPIIESDDRLPAIVNDGNKPGYTKAQIERSRQQA